MDRNISERMENTWGLVSDRTYNLVIGATILWGCLLNTLMATFLATPILRMNMIVVLIIYLVGTFGCIILINASRNATLSFAGFTGLAISMGILLTFYVTHYTGAQVRYAFAITALVTVFMMGVSYMFPRFFLSIGRSLGIALLSSFIIMLVGMLLHLPLGFFDYIIALIFAGFIGYDWAKAQVYPMNAVNAIACAADIYVDIVNLFIRILAIIGDSDR